MLKGRDCCISQVTKSITGHQLNSVDLICRFEKQTKDLHKLRDAR